MLNVANTGTKHSQVIPAENITSGSIQASFSDASAAGTITLEGSNDPPSQCTTDSNGNLVPVNWSLVKNGSINASATVASGALTTISLQWLNSKWLRATWVESGGAGTFTVNGLFQEAGS